MPKRGKSGKPKVRVGNAYASLPLPSGVPVPMCFCGDPCKVGQSDEEDTYKQRVLDVRKLCLRPTTFYDLHWATGENVYFCSNTFDVIM